MHRSLLTIITLLLVSTPVNAQEWEGCWAGTIGEDANARRAVFHLAQDPTGLTGTLYPLGRGIDTVALREITAGGDSLRFSVLRGDSPATFAGTVTDGVWSGSVARDDETRAATFRRTGGTPDPASAYIGYWSGWLSQAGTQVLRMGLEIAPAPCGQVLVTMDSPDQGVEDLPMNSFTIRGDSILYEMLYLQGRFRGEVQGESLIGLWAQGPGQLDARLGRSDSVEVVVRPQEPEPPFPYAEEDVVFVNPHDSTVLAGTLTLPPGDGPFPAAVLLTGSGAQDRNESLMGHKPFLVIADHLTRQGIAVLRYDDRGVGGSSGNVMNATLSDNANDALAAIALLRERADVNPGAVGLIGHSEGGWMAPVAAGRSDDVAFIIMLAGPAVGGEAILQAQGRAMSEAGGVPTEMVDGGEAVRAHIWRILREEANDSLARVRVLTMVDTVLTTLPPAQAAALDSAWNEPGAEEQFRQQLTTFTTRWFRDILTHEPAEALSALRIPVLAVFGGLDLQVPATQSVPILERVWAAHPDATIRVFDDLNHLFQHAETGHVSEYARIEETFAPEVLALMGGWILERFGAR